jgi:Cu2+-exporting ATPase
MTLVAETISSNGDSAAPADVTCAHCGLAVPPRLIVDEAENQFCCTGCEAVYQTLHACGLELYYRLRDAAANFAELQPARVSNGTFEAFDSPTFHKLYVQTRADGLATADLALDGVSCAACVWLLERLPRVLDGVIDARLSLREATVRITWDPKRVALSRVGRVLDSLGYTPYPSRGRSGQERFKRENRKRLIHLAAAGAIMGNTMLLAFALYSGGQGGQGHMDEQYRMFFRWISALLATISLAWPGATFFRSAWAAIRLRAVNLDVPIALALAVGGIAGLINVILNRGEIYFDSLTVLIFLLLVGRFIQYRQQWWADDAVGLLFNLTPSICRIVQDGVVIEAPIESLDSSDLVEVRPGDLFPADGIVEWGSSTANEALLTGESKPVVVESGTAVHAGAQNIGGVLRVRVLQVGADTRVGQLMRLIERGAQEKPAIVQFADRVGGVFVVAVSLAAAATFAFWAHRSGLPIAIDAAVALLIVTCPCVLGLATPLTLAIAIGRLARNDILVKSGAALERLSRGGSLILDKTGTLTEGRLKLLEWHGDLSVRGLVAHLERHSNHPVGRALVESLEDCEAEADVRSTHWEITEQGGGVKALSTARTVYVGSPTFVERNGVTVSDSSRAIANAIESQGATAVVVAIDEKAVAFAALGDRVRSDSRNSVAKLRKLGWQPSILSGDAQDVVRMVAERVDIDPLNAIGGQSPEEKLARIGVHETDRTLVMVGDGVNDAAALAAADVGIAVHGGAEASLAAADVYIARPGLSSLVELAEVSRLAMRTIHRNLTVSLGYNIFAGLLAACGVMSPLIAAIIMPVSSATVLGLAVLTMKLNEKKPAEDFPSNALSQNVGA